MPENIIETEYVLNTETDMVEEKTRKEVIVPIDIVVLNQTKTTRNNLKAQYKKLMDDIDIEIAGIDAMIAKDAEVRAQAVEQIPE